MHKHHRTLSGALGSAEFWLWMLVVTPEDCYQKISLSCEIADLILPWGSFEIWLILKDVDTGRLITVRLNLDKSVQPVRNHVRLHGTQILPFLFSFLFSSLSSSSLPEACSVVSWPPLSLSGFPVTWCTTNKQQLENQFTFMQQRLPQGVFFLNLTRQHKDYQQIDKVQRFVRSCVGNSCQIYNLLICYNMRIFRIWGIYMFAVSNQSSLCSQLNFFHASCFLLSLSTVTQCHGLHFILFF